jgi:hypothetical protein
MEHLSVWDLYEGKPEGELLYWGFWMICKTWL